jgi:hypothetical protein
VCIEHRTAILGIVYWKLRSDCPRQVLNVPIEYHCVSHSIAAVCTNVIEPTRGEEDAAHFPGSCNSTLFRPDCSGNNFDTVLVGFITLSSVVVGAFVDHGRQEKESIL